MKLNYKRLQVLGLIAVLVSLMTVTTVKLFGNGPIAIIMLSIEMAICFPTFAAWYFTTYHAKTDIH